MSVNLDGIEDKPDWYIKAMQAEPEYDPEKDIRPTKGSNKRLTPADTWSAPSESTERYWVRRRWWVRFILVLLWMAFTPWTLLVWPGWPLFKWVRKRYKEWHEALMSKHKRLSVEE